MLKNDVSSVNVIVDITLVDLILLFSDTSRTLDIIFIVITILLSLVITGLVIYIVFLKRKIITAKAGI